MAAEPHQRFAALRREPAAAALAAAAGETPVHLVGGALRDRLLGRPTHDLDAVVAGRGEEIASDLARRLSARLVRLGGDRFAALRLVADGLTVDLWDRGEVPLRDDLARRDFTVNSFALDLARGRVEDPFGGLADLGSRLLRAVTRRSFTGDPLRVLRLPRFVAQLPGFSAEPRTVALAREAAARLREVAAERVREELLATFAAAGAPRALALLAELGLYPGLWRGRPGEELPPAAGPALLGHLEAEIGRLRELVPGGRLHLQAARLALAFLGLRPDGDPGAALASFREAGYLAGKETRVVRTLLGCSEPPRGDLRRRLFLHAAGDELWLTAVAVVSALAREAADEAWLSRERPPLVALAGEEGQRIFDPPRLLTGDEVRQLLGDPSGPEIGSALAGVRRAQIEGRITTREEAARLVTGGPGGGGSVARAAPGAEDP